MLDGNSRFHYIPEDGRDNNQHESNPDQINFTEATTPPDNLKKSKKEIVFGSSKHTTICGVPFNGRQLWVLAILLILFVLSCMGAISLFAISIFGDSTVDPRAPPLPKLTSKEAWEGPNVNNLIKVYIFNYTNTEEYEQRTAGKLHVEEIGPFVYEELVTKINVEFHDNDTVSYRKHRIHIYRADLSNERKLDDIIIVPNMALMGAAVESEYMSYISKTALSSLLSSTDSKAFSSLSIEDFLWGYVNSACRVLKEFLGKKSKIICNKNGLLASRNGTPEDVITVHVGKTDTNSIGQINDVNGQNELEYWLTEECNKIRGSDGLIFPPDTVREKKPVDVYYEELCRRFEMTYEKEVEVLGEKDPAYKYVLPENVFDSPKSNPENQCYCDMKSKTCAPQGLFNSTLCSFGVPIFTSFPHFYKADPTIRNAISGLNSNPENYGSSININSTSGFLISGVFRLQMNVQVIKSTGIDQLDMFNNNIMLPISWMEVEIKTENILEYGRRAIKRQRVNSISSPAITFLKVGFLVMTVVTCICIVMLFLWKT